jgi:hypothetical protein
MQIVLFNFNDMKIGIELELMTLLIMQTVFISAFAKFEIETPLLKKLLKWFFIDAITIGLYFWINHWAILLPIIGLILGTIYHFYWCRKNGIHPFRATPKKKYYALRKWKWEE